MSEREPLKAGALALELEEGALRYFKFGQTEVLRRVYAAVRDGTWETLPGRVIEQHREIEADSFYIVFRRLDESEDGQIRFAWEGSLVGSEDGSVTFSMEGEALTEFLSNRIGLCVLHPSSASGASVQALHTDGTITESRFPELISPQQPFFDLRGILHKVSTPGQPECWLETRFAGDVFEMEDQRNWTDASYKTYSTPLSLPFPVRVAEGTRIRQSVSVRLLPPPPKPARSVARFVSRFIEPTFEITETPKAEPLPLLKIGFGGMIGNERPDIEARVRALKPAHLRVRAGRERDSSGSEGVEFVNFSEALPEIPREVALTLSGNAEACLQQFAERTLTDRTPLARILLFHENEVSTNSKWVTLAKEILRPAGINAPIYGGTDRYFTELNRGRPDPAPLDGITYSINPQVHAFDDASLIETFEAIPLTAHTARSFAPGLPISVSPVSLKPRGKGNDPRQAELFGAGWTLGAVEALIRARVDSATFYSVFGLAGLMDASVVQEGQRWVKETAGAIFPLYHVFRDLADFAGGEMIPLSGNDPLQLAALRLRNGTRQTTLYANLTRRPIRVKHSILSPSLRVRTLDTTTNLLAMHDPEAFRTEKTLAVSVSAGLWPLPLKPHAYVCVEETGLFA